MTQATIDSIRHRVKLLRVMLNDYEKLPREVQKRRAITIGEMLDSIDTQLIRVTDLDKPINAKVKEELPQYDHIVETHSLETTHPDGWIDLTERKKLISDAKTGPVKEKQ